MKTQIEREYIYFEHFYNGVEIEIYGKEDERTGDIYDMMSYEVSVNDYAGLPFEEAWFLIKCGIIYQMKGDIFMRDYEMTQDCWDLIEWTLKHGPFCNR